MHLHEYKMHIGILARMPFLAQVSQQVGSSQHPHVAILPAALVASNMAAPTATNEELYGPRNNVNERFPHATSKGEIWAIIDSSYPKTVEFRPIFDASGAAALDGHPQNPRNLVSAQRRYALRVINDGYDPQGRGLPEGMEGDRPGTTLLLGGKQLGKAILKAATARPDSPNVQRALTMGYQVCMRPKNMPRDVIDEIVAHSNLNNKGVKDTVTERVQGVPKVQESMKAHLSDKRTNKNAMPTKGDYTYHKVYAAHVQAKFSDLYPSWQVFQYAKYIHDNLAKMPHESDGTNQLAECIDWIENNGDAEAIEGDIGRIMGVLSRWTFVMTKVMHLFRAPNDLPIFRSILLVGLEATLPIDPSSPIKENKSYGTPCLPYVFGPHMKYEEIETKMNYIVSLVQGLVPSNGVPVLPGGVKRSAAGKKRKGEAGTAALEALKNLATEDADVSSSTLWIDTVKTAINIPFELIARFGGKGACDPNVSFCVVRRSLHWAWTEKCPPLVIAFKKWGPVRQSVIKFTIDQHPQTFSPTAMNELKGLSDDKRDITMSTFMLEFGRLDPAGSMGAAEDEGLDATAGLVPSSSAGDATRLASLAVLRRVERLYRDESMMLGLAQFTTECNLKTEWGWQMMALTRDILEKGSAAINSLLVREGDSLVEAVGGILWEVLGNALDVQWCDFVGMVLPLVYNVKVDGCGLQHIPSIAGSVKDTCDSIFSNDVGATRFFCLRVLVQIFIFQRLLPKLTADGAYVLKLAFESDQYAFVRLAAAEKLVSHDFDAWMGFWLKLLACRCVDSFMGVLTTTLATIEPVVTEVMEAQVTPGGKGDKKVPSLRGTWLTVTWRQSQGHRVCQVSFEWPPHSSSITWKRTVRQVQACFSQITDGALSTRTATNSTCTQFRRVRV